MTTHDRAAEELERIARAVLYEGYILWPYRRSAIKNQRRWTFGGILPRDFSEDGHEDDPWALRTECLLEAGADTPLSVTARFLHVVERRPGRTGPAGDLRFEDEIVVAGERHLAWDEATEREADTGPLPLGNLERPHRISISVPSGREEEELSEDGRTAGALVRRWRRLQGSLEVAAAPLETGLWKVSATVANTTPWNGGTREEALRQALVSTHLILRTAETSGPDETGVGAEGTSPAEGGLEKGGWISLTDPPDRCREAAAGCRNTGLWPVLVGAERERHTLLASPIILPDYPRVAPESPGDLFDGAEIDQLLIQSVLALTEEEQAEMRATDPRAREILDRCASLTREERMRLHGTIRERRPLRRSAEP